MRTKSIKFIHKKEMQKQKVAWLVGYVALCKKRNTKSPFQLLPARVSALRYKLSKRLQTILKSWKTNSPFRSPWVFEWEEKIKLFFPIFSFHFVYHDSKIIYRCFESSIFKSGYGRNLHGLLHIIFYEPRAK